MNTVEEVNAVFASAKSPGYTQPELLHDDSLDAMYICPVNTSKPRHCVFADLELADSHSTRPTSSRCINDEQICVPATLQ